MSKKQNYFMEKMKFYYEESKKCHVSPTEGIDSGAGGKYSELLTKMILGNTSSRGVTSNGNFGGFDTRKKIGGKWETFETKVGCGEVGVIREDGTVIKKSASFMIYARNSGDTDISHYSVFKMNTWYELFESNELLREKYSSPEGKKAKREGRKPRNDRITIQTINTSQKKIKIVDDIISMGVPLISLVDRIDAINKKIDVSGIEDMFI